MIMKVLVIFVILYLLNYLIKTYTMENFNVTGERLISNSLTPQQCQSYCKKTGNKYANFSKNKGEDVPQKCWVSSGRKQELLPGGEEKRTWVNEKYVEPKPILIAKDRDTFSGWKSWGAWWGVKPNYGYGTPDGNILSSRIRFQPSILTDIRVKYVYAKDQGWGNPTYLNMYGITNEGRRVHLWRKHIRNTNRFNVHLNESYLKNRAGNNKFVEILFTPGRLGLGHRLTYGGISEITIHGFPAKERYYMESYGKTSCTKPGYDVVGNAAECKQAARELKLSSDNKGGYHSGNLKHCFIEKWRGKEIVRFNRAEPNFRGSKSTMAPICKNLDAGRYERIRGGHCIHDRKYKNVSNVTRAHCQKLCDNDNNCRAYAFRAWHSRGRGNCSYYTQCRFKPGTQWGYHFYRKKGYSYVNKPNVLKNEKYLGGDPNIGRLKKLKECEGDCDRDSDCRPGLKCHQRESLKTSTPGCTNRKKMKWLDICYDPKKMKTTYL